MSHFSPEWLALREPLDNLARDASLATRLIWHLNPSEPLSLVDLGSGTGSNLRYLAPKLGGEQHWLLLDHDPELLRTARTDLQHWSRRMEARWWETDDALYIEHRAWRCRIRSRIQDLASDLDGLDLSGVHCVTTAALLDLVSESWLRKLAQLCRDAGCAIAFALNYDGRLRWQPRDPFDATLRHLLNNHQLTDKGFGPALGPYATAACLQLFGAQGYQLSVNRSEWRIGPTDQTLQTALLDDWTQAVQGIAPGQGPQIAAWRAHRARHIALADSRLTVGHRDVLGWLKRP
ncbi:MAG: class I SAM-dependent methyltransferase [Gammaproteobacteria bacterium]|nr:class I SAM-dependent methyltransferase [Gammaproteobacteria bacterium]MCP5426068.1 class I SAM-dependent methyltransferase [Gammaproteobacteria bacterium]